MWVFQSSVWILTPEMTAVARQHDRLLSWRSSLELFASDAFKSNLSLPSGCSSFSLTSHLYRIVLNKSSWLNRHSSSTFWWNISLKIGENWSKMSKHGRICRCSVKMRAWATCASLLLTHLILYVTATKNKCYWTWTRIIAILFFWIPWIQQGVLSAHIECLFSTIRQCMIANSCF